VSPFIVASVVPPAERDLRVRGRLRDVDTAAGSYTVKVRPFHHHQHSTGELEVHTTVATAFEIDGVAYSGAAGLAQLATLADGTLVIAFGSLDTSDFHFTAQRVLAGERADELRRDHLAGTVLSRSGDTLVVGGVRLHWAPGDNVAAEGYHRHHGRYLTMPMTLQVGPGTIVTRAGQNSGSLASGIISVGQRIQAFGDVSRDGTGQLVMDATAGLVRLNYTRLVGMVTASEPGKLTLDLHSIHGLRPARFDFAGTGMTVTDDADPDAYEVAAGAGLNTAALPAGAYTRVFGFVTPFGLAPPDFNATTLVDYAASRGARGAGGVRVGGGMRVNARSAPGLTRDTAFPPSPGGGIRGGGGGIGVE
jgi:hypothetical protein